MLWFLIYSLLSLVVLLLSFYALVLIPYNSPAYVFEELREKRLRFRFTCTVRCSLRSLLVEQVIGALFWIALIYLVRVVHSSFRLSFRVSARTLAKFTLLSKSLYVMSSSNIQEAYDRAAAAFNDSSSSIAQAIALSKEKAWLARPDECESAITTMLSKGKIYVTKSMRNKLLWRSVPSAVLGHFNTGFVPAVSTKESKKPTVSNVVLSEAVQKYLADVGYATAQYKTSATGKIRGVTSQQPAAIVRVDVMSLRTESLVSQSNAGVTLSLALDGRAKKPEAAILGGHLHFTKDDAISTSLFYPRFSLSSQEKNLDECVQVWSTSQGYNLKPGSIASATCSAMVGEVTTQIGATSMIAPVMDQLEKSKRQTMSLGALPIHPYRPVENNVDEVVMDWEGATSSLDFVGSSAGVSEWAPRNSEGNRSIRFSGLKMIDGPGTSDSKHFITQEEIQEEESPREPRERPNVRPRPTRNHEDDFVEEGDGMPMQPIVIAKEHIHFPDSDYLKEDVHIYTGSVPIPQVATETVVLAFLNLFEGMGLDDSRDPFISKLKLASLVVPKFKVRIRFSLPSMYSCPIIISWDEGRCIGDTYALEDLVQLPFCVVGPTVGQAYTDFSFETYGRTGAFSLARKISCSAGTLYFSCMPHDFATLEGKISLHYEIWLGEGTIVSQGLFPQLPNQRATLVTGLTERTYCANLVGNTHLGRMVLDHNTETEKFFLLAVRPGVGAISSDGKTIYGSNMSALCANWAFWNGTACISVNITARQNVAGQLSIYTLPPGYNTRKLREKDCYHWPREVITFNGSQVYKFKALANSWLGACSTVGGAFVDQNDQNGNTLSFAVFINAGPSSCAGFSTQVDVLFTLTNIEDLTLSERITPQTHRAPRPTANYAPRKPWESKVLATRTEEIVEQGFGIQPPNFHRLYTLRNLKQTSEETWILPFTLAEPKRSNWKNCKVYNYESPELAADKEPLVIIDSTNPYRLLVQGSCFYSCHLEASVSLSSTKKKASAVTVGILKNPFYHKEIGRAQKDGDVFGGGLRDATSILPGNIAILTQPERENIRSCCRPDLEKSGRAFLDTPSFLCIIIPANSDVTEVEIGYSVKGPLSLYGIGLPSPVDIPSASKDRYMPHLTVGNPVVATTSENSALMPIGWWDSLKEEKLWSKFRKHCELREPTKEQVQYLERKFRDNCFRVYNVYEPDTELKSRMHMKFTKPRFTPGQDYALNMQLWLGSSRDNMYELIWRFDDTYPDGYIISYSTNMGNGNWDKHTQWMSTLDRFAAREDVDFGLQKHSDHSMTIFIDGLKAGIVRGCTPLGNILAGWEYQVDLRFALVGKGSTPFSFRPTGTLGDVYINDLPSSMSLVRVETTAIQSNTSMYPLESVRVGVAPARLDYYLSDNIIFPKRGASRNTTQVNRKRIERHGKLEEVIGEDEGGTRGEEIPTQEILSASPYLGSTIPVAYNTNIKGKGKGIEPMERVRIGSSWIRERNGRRRPEPMYSYGRLEKLDNALRNEPQTEKHHHFKWRGIEASEGTDYQVCYRIGRVPFFGCCERDEAPVNIIPLSIREEAEESVRRRVLEALNPDELFEQYSHMYSQDILMEACSLTIQDYPQGNIKYVDMLDGVLKEFGVNIRDYKYRVNCGCCGKKEMVLQCNKGWRLNALKRGGFSVREGRRTGLDYLGSPSWAGGVIGITSDLTPVVTRQAFGELVDQVAESMFAESKNNVPGYLKELEKFHPGALGL
nr:polyprotein 2 [Black raspberry necrosis virus]